MLGSIDLYSRQHRAKHVLAHVLSAVGSDYWPECTLGRSGETPTGFFADFSFPPVPGTEELTALTDRMAAFLDRRTRFRPLELTTTQALHRFRSHPWKRYQVEALSETETMIRAFELNGFIDVCDCVLKDPAFLAEVHPEHFCLVAAETTGWNHRGRTDWFLRIQGELFPRPSPCPCCAGLQ